MNMHRFCFFFALITEVEVVSKVCQTAFSFAIMCHAMCLFILGN